MTLITNFCVLCRGGKYLCGRPYCYVLTKIRVWNKIIDLKNSKELFGTSPPAVFVGRKNYPYVYVGPMTPAEHGDTSLYDFPELWRDLEIDVDRIIEMRLALVLGRTKINVLNIHSKISQTLHELILNVKPTDIEMIFEKPPAGFMFSEYEPPIGPRAPLASFRIVGSTSSSHIVEKIYNDTDVNVRTAVIELYSHGIPVSYIQKLVSVGALGKKKLRKFVPTRWSITAVDDIISKHIVEKRIKDYKEIESIYLFVRSIHKNLFIAILIPGKWCFEWMEAWFPRSTWNMLGEKVVIEGDYELFSANRNTYASIGGCYYAARLATAEYLEKISRQAIAIVLREIYPGFDLPIGVWFVREQLRAMYKEKPVRVNSFEEAFKIVEKFSKIGVDLWMKKSYILRKLFKEKKIDEYLNN